MFPKHAYKNQCKNEYSVILSTVVITVCNSILGNQFSNSVEMKFTLVAACLVAGIAYSSCFVHSMPKHRFIDEQIEVEFSNNFG